MITVFLSSVTAFSTSPSISSEIPSKSSPSSSLITVAPVKIAKSSTVSCFVGPNPGKSTIFTLMLPLTLFIRSADFTCWLTCATISKDRLFFIANSSIFCIFLTFGISDVTIKTSGFSKIALCFSVSVVKWVEVIPQSIWTPSTMSIYVFSVSDVSISTTPSLPTFL